MVLQRLSLYKISYLSQVRLFTIVLLWMTVLACSYCKPFLENTGRHTMSAALNKYIFLISSPIWHLKIKSLLLAWKCQYSFWEDRREKYSSGLCAVLIIYKGESDLADPVLCFSQAVFQLMLSRALIPLGLHGRQLAFHTIQGRVALAPGELAQSHCRW